VNTLLIRTKRLSIRNLRDSDLEAFLQYRSNPEITKYQGYDIISRDQAIDFISQQKEKDFGLPGEWVQYAIESTDRGVLIGDCAIHLRRDDPDTAELGITISDLYQRQGYGKEAMEGLINYLFHQKKIHRIIETVDTENEASIALLKSLSFRQEAHHINNVFFKGKWGSEFQFGMLLSEWEPLPGGR
jgi:[ribosomal protein S5]-alanine N-acetyltransferase